jgi:hypothetical protein
MAGNQRSNRQVEKLQRTYQEILDRDQGPVYWLVKDGLGPPELVAELKKQLNATQVKVFNSRDDGIVYSDELVDWATRSRALELAIKLWGMMPKEKVEVDIKNSLVERILAARERSRPTDG